MITRADALFRAYPNVTHAVSWVELVVCDADPGERSAWDEIFRHGRAAGIDFDPRQVVGILADALEEDIREGTAKGRSAEALAEMRHPEFLRYVAGKMGAY